MEMDVNIPTGVEISENSRGRKERKIVKIENLNRCYNLSGGMGRNAILEEW